nr:multi-fuction esterase [uncultured bacterium]
MPAKTRLSIATALAAIGLAHSASAADCSDLTQLQLDNGQVTAATLIEAGKFTPPTAPGAPPGVGAGNYANLPAFCRVQAILTPTPDSDIKVEVWLPADNWNGKYVGIGNGVWAGQLSLSQLADPLSRGYAAATTDTGHSGNGLSADWAVGHPEKLVDFGHRAVHLMTVTAKQAIEAFYGNSAEYSFWNSCSTGGRQGLMAASRYPDDYDAISAMAPANPMTDLMTQSMWASWVNKRSADAQLDPGKLSLIHQAVMNQCDALDGLEDGVIGRPDACTFDPASLVNTSNGLTQAQADAMQAIYDGVRASDGSIILPGWPRGAEMQLTALVMGPEPFPVAMSWFKLLVHGDDSSWNWLTMDWSKEIAASRDYGADILNVSAETLAPFFARGGKLLLSHGWNDGLIPANNTVKFYGELQTAGAPQDQLRLFMAPGMEHCAGGEGPNSFDTLGTLDAWVSTGQAPDRIVATRLSSPNPNAAQLPAMTRALCAYPRVARFDGTGNPAEEGNFSCELPDKDGFTNGN